MDGPLGGGGVTIKCGTGSWLLELDVNEETSDSRTREIEELNEGAT